MEPELLICRLGTVEYREALALQQSLRDRVMSGEQTDVLLLLDHPPVYTLGRRSGPGDLPMGEDWYRSQGIDIVADDRGGSLTYHGPGQLVGYPIMRIADVPGFVRRDRARDRLRARARGDRGPRPRGSRVHRRLGRRAQDRLIGLHVSRGVTTHGLAVNVDNDLQPFEWVVAVRHARTCG